MQSINTTTHLIPWATGHVKYFDYHIYEVDPSTVDSCTLDSSCQNMDWSLTVTAKSNLSSKYDFEANCTGTWHDFWYSEDYTTCVSGDHVQVVIGQSGNYDSKSFAVFPSWREEGEGDEEESWNRHTASWWSNTYMDSFTHWPTEWTWYEKYYPTECDHGCD